MTIIRNTYRDCRDPGDMAALLIGETPIMRQLRAMVTKIAPSSLPVLIQGPTGSGKELVAQAIHQWGGRVGPCVAFNVCALADTMFEDAFFGHVRGAFTGATTDALGYLAEADQGTVFLDEIGGLALMQQSKLLRAIETREFRPVGAARDRRSNFRVVAATNDDLIRLVERGTFRADLAQRLRGIVLTVPSLTERCDDIPLLVRSFAERANESQAIREITEGALSLLASYEWPGNVRELRFVVERALMHVNDGRLTRYAVAAAIDGAPAPREPGNSFARRRLVDVLTSCDWDTVRAASELGVHRATVYRQMKRLRITPEPFFSARLLSRPSLDVPSAH